MANIDDDFDDEPTREEVTMTFPVKLGIVGPRVWDDYDTFEKRVQKVLDEKNLVPSEIILGNVANDTYSMAAQFADENSINVTWLPVDTSIRTDGTRFSLLHRSIARKCTHLIIFQPVGDEEINKITEFSRTLKKQVFVFSGDSLSCHGCDFYEGESSLGLHVVRRPNESRADFGRRCQQEVQQWQNRRGQ